MMSTSAMVVLLRGINVGGKNRLPMADLRELAVAVSHLTEPRYTTRNWRTVTKLAEMLRDL